MRTTLRLLFLFASVSLASLAAAGLLGGSPPTIVIRNQPSSQFSTVYVSYVGSLSEMLVAEEEVKKILAKSGVMVLGSSADAASAAELQSDDFYAKVVKRIGSSRPPAAVLIIRSTGMAGSELSFQIKLHNITEATEAAVGEVTVDVDKQPTIGDGAALAARVAIRDVCRRFLRDKRIASFFRNGVS
jgi:hypothetical protein